MTDLDELARLEAAEPPPDALMLRMLLPGIDALLALNPEEAVRVLAGRPDVWVVIRAFLATALEGPSDAD